MPEDHEDQEEEQDLKIEDLKLSVTTQGRPYEIWFADFTAWEEKEFRDATGVDLMQVFLGEHVNALTVSGMVWVVRKRWEKNLKFEKVARKFKFGDLGTIVMSDGTEEPEAEDTSHGPPKPEVPSDPEV